MEELQVKKMFVFTLFLLIITTGCSDKQKPFSATYQGENDNWKVEDNVKVAPDKTEHTVIIIPKNKFNGEDIHVVITWNGVVETKTNAKRTDEGYYKTPTEPNTLDHHQQPLKRDMKLKVSILPDSQDEEARPETVDLSVVE